MTTATTPMTTPMATPVAPVDQVRTKPRTTVVVSPTMGPISEQARFVCQEVLDTQPFLELEYYEHEFSQSLVTAIVAQALVAVVKGGHVLAVGPSSYLAYCLLACGYSVDITPVNNQRLAAELDAHIVNPFEDLASERRHPGSAAIPGGSGSVSPDASTDAGVPGNARYDAIVLPRMLETLAGDPTHYLYGLRRLLLPEGSIIVATANLARFGTRWRALAGRDFQPSYLHKPQRLPGDWPPIQEHRFYTANEVSFLASHAGYRMEPPHYTAGHRAIFTMRPTTLPQYAATKLKFWTGNAAPRMREFMVTTLHKVPRFALPNAANGDVVAEPTELEVPGEDGVPYWRPFVSVVLPTHNRSAMLRDCLENGLFRQNYDADRWEIVLINDGSKDDTEAVVKELTPRSPVPIRYFKLEGRGAAAARNFGMREARGAIVAHIDDDARAVPGWLEAGVNQFRPGVAMVSGPIVADSTVTRGFFDYVMIMESDRGLFPTHNLLMRRDLALEEGGFDESFGANYLGRPLPGWDADLAYRILRKGYTHVFCEDAVTASFVFPLTWRQWFRELTKFQFQGRIVQRVPETRRGLAPIGGIVIEGRKRLYWLLSLMGIVLAPFFGLRTLLLTLPWLFRTASAVGEDLRHPRRLPKGVAKIGLAWLWYAGSFIFVVYGAIKARKLLV